nr:immunoglobulin light chain junction region [Macaca mulatta]MOX81521.1 immunoglobulin light chain junction region [Macaca mulatta]
DYYCFSTDGSGNQRMF